MTDDVYPRALRWVKKKILNKPQVLEFITYIDGEYAPREGLVAEVWEQQQEWYGPSMEYFQHVISSRPPIHRRRRRGEVHVGGATPMDVDDIQDIRATLTRVDESYRGLADRVRALEHDATISRVTGRHSVSDSRPTTLSGSTPPQFSQPGVARHSFHMGNTMGGGMNSSSYYAQPAFGQSSTFGMTGPTGFAPPAHDMAGSSFFIPTPNTPNTPNTPAVIHATGSLDPMWGEVASMIIGSPTTFNAFGQMYGGMGGPSGSSQGAGFDTVIPPSDATHAVRDTTESESETQTDTYESDPDPEPEERREINLERSPRPPRQRKQGEKTKDPWTSGKGLSGKLKGLFGGKGKGKK